MLRRTHGVISIDGLFGIGALPDGGSVQPGGGVQPVLQDVVDQAGPYTDGTDKGPAPSGGWPAAMSVDPRYWVEVSASPSGWGYRVHSGMTLSGWAATYLGDPSRWKEFWAYQPTDIRLKYSPNNIPVGTVMWAPEEAVKTAKGRDAVPAVSSSGRAALIIGGVVASAAVVTTAILLVLRRPS